MKKLLLFLLFIGNPIFAKSPELMLVEQYQDQDISGWVMSEKLDGVRGFGTVNSSSAAKVIRSIHPTILFKISLLLRLTANCLANGANLRKFQALCVPLSPKVGTS